MIGNGNGSPDIIINEALLLLVVLAMKVCVCGGTFIGDIESIDDDRKAIQAINITVIILLCGVWNWRERKCVSNINMAWYWRIIDVI